MISKRRLAANRCNALKSTGPRSAVGKRIVSMNALKHGLCSARVLLEEESVDAFERLRAELIRELRPQGPIEHALFERLANCAFKLRRSRAMEQAAMEIGFCGADPRRATHCAQRQRKDQIESIAQVATLARYAQELFSAQRKALRELRRVQFARRTERGRETKNTGTNPFFAASSDGAEPCGDLKATVEMTRWQGEGVTR